MIASWWGWKRILKILMNHSPLDYVCGKLLVAGGGVGGDMNIVLRDTGAGVSDYVTRLPLTQWNNETWPPASSSALERKIKMKIGESPFLVSIDSAKLHKYGIWNMIISLLKVLLQKLYLISSCGLQHVIILDCFTILHAFSISSHILGETTPTPTTERSKNVIM